MKTRKLSILVALLVAMILPLQSNAGLTKERKGLLNVSNGNKSNNNKSSKKAAKALEEMTNGGTEESDSNGSPLEVMAQTYRSEYPNFQYYPFDENELEWSEFKEKAASAQIKNNVLTLMNLGFKEPVMTYTELPFDPNNDFLIQTILFMQKLNKSTNYSVIINMEDEYNMGLLTLNSQSVTYTQIKDGKEVYSQSSFINDLKGKNVMLTLSIKKSGGKVEVWVNNDPCLKIRKIDYAYTGFGFQAYKVQCINVVAVGCGNADKEDDN